MGRDNSAAHRAVIWDVDGTLVDTAELHYRAWVELAGQYGWPFTREDFAATFGRRNPEIIRQLFGHGFTDDEVAGYGDEKEDLYRREAQKGVALLPGVRPLLEGLHAAGFLQAVGSSAPRRNIDLILELTGTRDFFAAIVSMENTTQGKPHPEVFLNAAQKLGVPPDRCLVMEDAVAGVEAAKAGGMKCVAVTFVGHHPADRLKAAGADLVVATLADVTVEQVGGILRG